MIQLFHMTDCVSEIASRLENNLTLFTISYMEQLDHIERFYLDLNRLGRRFIYQDEGILTRMWPHILARLATDDNIRLLFFFLRERVDLICRHP